MIYRGALLAVTMQWSLRLVGLVSVFILARLLTPHDFGLVGLAMATVALVEIFSVIGLRQALLRIDSPERSHLDTAWTIQLLLFSTLAVILILLAPLAAHVYREPALGPIIAVLASRFLFLGLVNIGIVDFDRNMEFGRDLRMRLGARLVGFAVTVAAALLLRSYWALVVGLVLQSALYAGASWLAHPYRPRFTLARRSELLGVSVWMFFGFSAQVVHHQLERLVIGQFSAMHMVGLYSVSKDLSAIFTQEVATALNRVTFVTTARGGQQLSDNPQRLGMMLGAYAMIAAPLGLGLAAVAEDAVAVLLGAQWLAAAPLLQLIAPASMLYAVYKLIASSLQASGLPKAAAALSGAGLVAAAACFTAMAMAGGDATAIAWTALAVSAAILAGGTIAIARVARVGPWSLVAHYMRPFAAAAAMLVAVRLSGLETGSPLADLAANVAIGAAVYAASLLLVWIGCRRPAGAEAEAIMLLERLGRRLAPVALPGR